MPLLRVRFLLWRSASQCLSLSLLDDDNGFCRRCCSSWGCIALSSTLCSCICVCCVVVAAAVEIGCGGSTVQHIQYCSVITVQREFVVEAESWSWFEHDNLLLLLPLPLLYGFYFYTTRSTLPKSHLHTSTHAHQTPPQRHIRYHQTCFLSIFLSVINERS